MGHASVFVAIFLLLQCATTAFAEYVEPGIDWKESAVPDPPAHDAAQLIPIDAPPGSSLDLGIDPATISVGADGVVRYVVVASSPQGARTVLFEGIRCSSAEFRSYARRNTDGDWSRVSRSDWQSLFAAMPSTHALAIARAGVCIGRAPNTPIDAMVRSLRQAARGR